MPASAAAIPPWIAQPADPAAHYAQGFQIGAHVGAQQAAQMFQAQQLALEQHKQLMQQAQQAYEDQMNTQVLNLKAAETARRFQANQEFRARVGAGEDPASVLMQLAPDLGESPTSILHSQAQRDMARATMRFKEANMQRLEQAGQERTQQHIQDREQRAQLAQERDDIARQREERMTAKDKAATLARIAKDEDLMQLEGDVRRAKRAQKDVEDATWHISSHKKAAQDKAAENLRITQAALDKRRTELMTEYGLAPSDMPAAPVEAPGTPGRAGDDTMPDQPSAPASTNTVKRLRFQNGTFVPIE